MPDGLKKLINVDGLANEPITKVIRDHYKAQGYSQGDFDKLFETMGELQAKGFLPDPIDFKAERAALGENGEVRQREIETWAKGLQSRGDITDREFSELMSLAPTAAGVTLIEKMRKMMNGAGGPQAPGEPVNPGSGDTEAQVEARALARDPRYGKEKRFTDEADRKWKSAFA